MLVPVDYDGYPRERYQLIGARAPQAASTSQTPSSISISIANTSPLLPDPSSYNTSSQPSNDNSTAVRTIIEYFFLIMALFVASILIFRRLFFRGQRRHELFSNNNRGGALSSSSSPLGSRSFSRTTGLPRVNLQGYPLLDNYFITLPLPTAYTTRRTRAQDIDLEGRRFTSAGAELDHGGVLRDKDALPKYESFGSPPKYAELEDEQQQLSVVAGIITPSTPVPPAAAAAQPRNATSDGQTPQDQTTTPSPQDEVSRSSSVVNTDSRP